MKKRFIKDFPSQLQGLTALYASVAPRIKGKNRVVRRTSGEDAPGFTANTGEIYLAEKHSLFDGLTDEETYAAREGIGVHEIMHQLLTDFDYDEFVTMSLPANERRIFATIANILEDPAIEYFASNYFGGQKLKSLQFIIYHTWKQSKGISEPYKGLFGMQTPSPFSQLMAAFIQFGDMGLLKGKFESKEAEELFYKLVGRFYEGIIEPIGENRVRIAKEIFDETRVLWEKDLEEQEKFEQFMEELSKILGDKFAGEMTGSGSGESGESGGSGSSGSSGKSSKDKRRQNMVKKAGGSSGSGKKDEKEKDDGSGSGKGKKDKDKNSKDSGKDGKDKQDGQGNKDGKDSKNNSSNGSSGGNSSDSSSDSSSMNNSDADSNSSDSNSNNGQQRIPANDGDGKVEKNDAAIYEHGDEGEESTYDEEEYELSEDDINYIREESEKIHNRYSGENSDSTSDTATPENFPIETPALRGKSCLNRNVTNNKNISAEYDRLVSKLSPQIRATVQQIKKIIEQDYESKVFKASGKINFDKLNNGRLSTRVFQRRVEPNGKRNLAVGILVDESGSMSGSNKYTAAGQSCVALAEIFNKLEIPVYVMGFTADMDGYDIVHYHYMKWNNTLNNRQKLLNISARYNNCDGYSIRYMTKILRKRKEQNKLLIVLSDGQPAARDYRDGIADTKAAIREARKYAHVLGVAIGNSDTETINNMYERNFLHISNVGDLFYGLSSELKNIFKKI